MDDLKPLSDAAKNFRPGIYRHYKGGVYHALCVGHDSEEPERELVTYRSLAQGGVWVRPFAMFLEDVKVGEYEGPRFTWVREAAWNLPDESL